MDSGVFLRPSVLLRWYQNLVSYGSGLVSESMMICEIDSESCVAVGCVMLTAVSCVCTALLWHCCSLVTSVVSSTVGVASDSLLASGCVITAPSVCCICNSVVNCTVGVASDLYAAGCVINAAIVSCTGGSVMLNCCALLDASAYGNSVCRCSTLSQSAAESIHSVG